MWGGSAVTVGRKSWEERFAQIDASFVTAADVADVLALTGEIDYRSAHKIVGRAVNDLVDAGDPPSQLTPERLAAASVAQSVGRSRSTKRRFDALDPAACAAARRQAGSSSEAAMDEMLDELHATLTARESWSKSARSASRLPRRRFSLAPASSHLSLRR